MIVYLYFLYIHHLVYFSLIYPLKKSHKNMSILLFLLFLLPFLILLSKILFTKSNNHKLPPSPPSLPFIGHLHLLNPRSTHRSLLSLSLNYGRQNSSGLIFLRMPSPTIVVSNASAAELVLKNHDVAFASRPASLSVGSFAGRNVSFTPCSDYWRQTKKLTTVHLLSQKRVFSDMFVAARAEEVTTMVTHIAAFKGEVNLSECFYAYVNGVVTRIVARKESDAQRFRELMGDISAVLAEESTIQLVAEVFPTIGKLWGNVSGINEKFKQYNKRWNEYIAEIVEERKKKTVNGEEGKEEDFIDVLLRLRDDGTVGFDINDIVAIIQDTTAAAIDTSFTTLEWTMSELIKNPAIMAKIQNEVRRIANNKSVIAEDDLNQMEYLRAVIKETLRLHPPAPLLLPHESTTAVSVHGYEIPPKTKLIINAWAIGRDSQTWDSPEEFRPERFINNDVDFRGNDFQFIPFGAGRRMCPGINFAMVTIEFALANLLNSFDWKLVGDDLDMDEGPGISVPRKNPLYLVPTKIR
ncbi:hypothetical protein LUZ60_011847 [Juncus effusus]|nr:hypothetical protein LUZ60_011847 [Juncus effusus]